MNSCLLKTLVTNVEEFDYHSISKTFIFLNTNSVIQLPCHTHRDCTIEKTNKVSFSQQLVLSSKNISKAAPIECPQVVASQNGNPIWTLTNSLPSQGPIGKLRNQIEYTQSFVFVFVWSKLPSHICSWASFMLQLRGKRKGAFPELGKTVSQHIKEKNRFLDGWLDEGCLKFQ